MFIKIIITLTLIFYVALNVLTARVYSTREMREEFIKGQNMVGMICTNMFYSPAWFLKLLRFCIINLVK